MWRSASAFAVDVLRRAVPTAATGAAFFPIEAPAQTAVEVVGPGLFHSTLRLLHSP